MSADHGVQHDVEVPGLDAMALRPVGEGGVGSSSRAARRQHPLAWRARHRASVVAVDMTAIILASAAYPFFGALRGSNLLLMALAVIALTATSLACARAWDRQILGQGSVEFSRLLRGMLGAAVALATICLAVDFLPGRAWVFGVLPIAGALATSGRIVLRRILHRRRRSGGALVSVLALGTVESLTSLIDTTRRAPHHGMRVAGACTPSGLGIDGTPEIDGVAVLGDLDAATRLGCTADFDGVAVAPTPGMTANRLQQLAWDLEGAGKELIVDPGLMEIAGPRLHMTNLDGLTLLRLTSPRLTGASRLLKSAVDRVGAVLLLLLLLPVLLAIAVMVACDGGPVFFRQKRVGQDGAEFFMVKFRSMVTDAEARLATLIQPNDGSGPLFKLHNDPRITRVGAVLRRYSLDELPQLFNVVVGSMSLVGPRPPLPREVMGYERDARRRLLVKPGMTGLWQVSGRSDLSWEQSVRLDLRYVENWSIALDAQILVKTVRAVLGGGGAY